MVHAFISTKLDFKNALLLGVPNNLLEKLQRIQNIAACIVTKTKTRDHITPVLKKLPWLPVRCRIQFKVLVLVFKALHGQAPQDMSDMLVKYIPSRGVRTSTQRRLVEPRTKKGKFGDRAFSKMAPKLWNTLPLDIRQSLNSFKRKLKHIYSLEHLIEI